MKRVLSALRILVVVAGLSSPICYFPRVPIGFVAAMALVSPAPNVFTQDVLTTDLFMTMVESSGSRTVVPLDPAFEAKARGPIARHNAFGHALAFAPSLPGDYVKSIIRYGFCAGGPVAKEYGLPGDPVSIVISTKLRDNRYGRAWSVSIECR